MNAELIRADIEKAWRETGNPPTRCHIGRSRYLHLWSDRGPIHAAPSSLTIWGVKIVPCDDLAPGPHFVWEN